MEIHANQTLLDQKRSSSYLDKTPYDPRHPMYKRKKNSILYTSLFEYKTDFSSMSCQAWEQNLNTNLTETEWETIYMYTHKGSLNVATQECGFKIIIRWYRTPTLLNKFSPQTSNRYWRCEQKEGSLLHIWWSCPLI